MIEYEGSLLFAVALQTQFTGTFIRVQRTYLTAVNLMAGTADHLAFPNRMPGR